MPVDPVPLEPTHDAAGARSRGGGDGRALVRAAPLFAALVVLAWAAATVATSSAQWGDHFEQFVWAHGLEWGYHKHPPLPTWLLAAVIAAFGPAPFWPDALAIACFVGTIAFTHAVARQLLGTAGAALAILLLGLLHAFSARATLFNHNTVMLLMVSATAWAVLNAVRRTGIAWWIAAGLAAGLAVLAKYQALLPLAGIAVGAWLAGDLASPASRRGALVAAAVAATLLAPHLVWLWHGGGAAIAHATQHGQSLPWPQRLPNLAGFVAQQLRFMLGPLLLFGILVLLPGTRSAATAGDGARCRAWLVGLLGFPLAATLLVALLLGLRLQNHWGYQALQFVTLWLAWRLRPLAPAAGASWFAAALAVHAVFLAIGLTVAPIGNAKTRIDRHFPAQQLADAVRRDWRNDTLCPLALVVGPSFEAGIVSVYNGGTAKVLEDGDVRKSPWIRDDDPQRLGAVYIAHDPADLPRRGVSVIDSMVVAGGERSRSRVYWAIAPPERCTAPAER